MSEDLKKEIEREAEWLSVVAKKFAAQKDKEHVAIANAFQAEALRLLQILNGDRLGIVRDSWEREGV